MLRVKVKVLFIYNIIFNYIRKDIRINEDYILLNFIFYNKEFSNNKSNYIILSIIESIVNNNDKNINIEFNDNIR